MLVDGLDILVVEPLSVRSSSGVSGLSGASGMSGFGGRGADGGVAGLGAAGTDGGDAGLGAAGAAGGGPVPARRIGESEKPNAHVVDDAPSRRSRSEENCMVNGCTSCDVRTDVLRQGYKPEHAKSIPSYMTI
jgi:hypothetical protein